MAQLTEIDARSGAALARVEEVSGGSTATIDALLQRSAEALDEIRGGIDLQSQAVSALVDQAKTGIGRTGIEAADAIGSRLASAQGSLDALAARVVEQDAASQRMIAGIGGGLAALDERFASLAADGDSVPRRSARRSPGCRANSTPLPASRAIMKAPWRDWPSG